jgi:branched-chain amino acid transport system ATP-binding protein
LTETATPAPLLEFEGVHTYYGQIHILDNVSIKVGKGELVCLLGGNASGKSTTLKTSLGIVKPRQGRVLFDGEDVTGRPTSYRIGRGMAIVPENRRLFAPMSVRENLEMGGYLEGGGRKEDFERVYSLFPLLYERRKQLAGTLSGGEQQMLAIARALMARPRLLLLDEPSLGLAPLIVKQIFTTIRELNRTQGITVFLVEQNAFHALKLADRGYVMVNGRITMSGPGKELLARDEIRSAYLEGGVH